MSSSAPQPDPPLTWAAVPAFARALLAVLRGRVVLALVLAVALGFTEGLAFLLLVPLLGAVGIDIASGSVGSLGRFIVSGLSVVGLTRGLTTALVLYASVITVQASLSRWQLVTVLAVEHQFSAALRKRLYAAIAHARWSFLARTRASTIARILTQEVERAGFAAYQALSLVVHVCVAMVYLAMALRLSPLMTMGVLAAGAVVLTTLHGRLRMSRAQGERVAESNDRLFTAAVEHVAALRIAKSYGVEERHITSMNRVADELALTQVDAIQTSAGSRAWFEIGGVLALALLLWIGLQQLHMAPGGVLLLLYVYARTMPRLSAVQQGLQNFGHYLPSLATVEQLRLESEAAAEQPDAGGAALPFTRAITLEDVTYVHGATDTSGISNLSLTIPFGSMTAIIGPSGAGKSTFADLLCGLYQPQSGAMQVDEVRLSGANLSQWKAAIGYVNQDTFLFNETIRANLLWASPSSSDDDLRTALRLARADFVFTLPLEMATTVGDRGQQLSGGERQRLALARALLRKPALLVLDEATSALDADNEARILASLRELCGTMTVVLITHRVNAVHQADCIHLFDAGRLVASGDWNRMAHRLAERAFPSSIEVA